MSGRMCALGDCQRLHYGLGYCKMHYYRFKRTGSVSGIRQTVSAWDRFWAKVDGTIVCWEWTAATLRGYGKFHPADGEIVQAHRYAYELLIGPVPDGLTLDHLCRNTLCVNPDHLEPVTMRENTYRGYGITGMNVRKTHCPQGHPYDEQNTIIQRSGKRKCRACNVEYNRRRRAQRREVAA